MEKRWSEEIREEELGINIHNEGSLHSQIKRWYAKEKDRFEVKVGRYIIDIVRNNELIEIQTTNFGAIKNKIKSLVADYRVRLVHPVCEEKWIITIGRNREVISKRRSPKKGSFISLFDELIRCPELINEENFSLEILLIKAEEIRCQDGRGSWRRKGLSIEDKTLLDVTNSMTFKTKEDFIFFLPQNLPQPFTNKILAQYLNTSIYQATRVTYCLKKMDIIKAIGKQGNSILYEKNPSKIS